jgi:CheY-like chemotaxis protein
MSTQHPSPHPLTVLVVDDSADTVESVAELLTLRHHAVRTALDGESALRSVAADPPDVVLLDIWMPGLDGWAVARLIRERCAGAGKCPLLVAVTGSGSDAARLRSVEAGFDLHMVKPVDPAFLLGLMERFRQILAPSIPADELGLLREDPPHAGPVPKFGWYGGQFATGW